MTHYSKLAKEELDEILSTNLEDFGLSPHIIGILDTIDVYDVRGLLSLTEERLLELRGCNKKTVARIKSFLSDRGFY